MLFNVNGKTKENKSEETREALRASIILFACRMLRIKREDAMTKGSHSRKEGWHIGALLPPASMFLPPYSLPCEGKDSPEQEQ